MAARDNTLMSLLHKAQEIIGSTLTSMDMQCLTALYAYYGLSPEFILTVMGYCKSIDKLSMRYVEKTDSQILRDYYGYWNTYLENARRYRELPPAQWGRANAANCLPDIFPSRRMNI